MGEAGGAAWEPVLAYGCFVEFYLMQEPPHSIVEAYRRYRITTGSRQDHKKRIRKALGVWENSAYARDHDGAPIPYAISPIAAKKRRPAASRSPSTANATLCTQMPCREYVSAFSGRLG